MANERSPRPARRGRMLRWSIGAAVAVVLLAVYWVALDRVATRVGQDAENTLRSLPVTDEARLGSQ